MGDELQKEAEEMNELGIRKLPRDDDHGGPHPEKDTTDEDSDFEEGYRKKSKPIMIKIKKERVEGGEDGKDDDGGSDESDWEPEAELSVSQRESRSGRQRKRPSIFQEFEETQAKEFGKPRQPKPEKPPSERKPRKRKPKVQEVEIEEQVETEVLRSGRKRKVRRVMANFMDEDDEDVDGGGRGASSDDDDFEPPPEEEVHLLEKKDDEIEDSDFEEGYRKKSKPIMMKIKKERVEGGIHLRMTALAILLMTTLPIHLMTTPATHLMM